MSFRYEPFVLPEDFSPTEYDCICGWARQNFGHGKCKGCSLGFYLILQDKTNFSIFLNYCLTKQNCSWQSTSSRNYCQEYSNLQTSQNERRKGQNHCKHYQKIDSCIAFKNWLCQAWHCNRSMDFYWLWEIKRQSRTCNPESNSIPFQKRATAARVYSENDQEGWWRSI